jgi:Zn finger protein HypA/HybF involved in hydrogenase expression
MRLMKKRIVDAECPKCGHRWEDFIDDSDELVECPKCETKAKPIFGGKLYPHPKSSSWSVG